MAKDPADLLARGSDPLLENLRRALSQLHERTADVEATVAALRTGQSQSIDSLVAQITNNFSPLLTETLGLVEAIRDGDFITAEVLTPAAFVDGISQTLTLAPGSTFPFRPTSTLLLRRTASSDDYAFVRLDGWAPETRALSCTAFLAAGSPGPHDDVVVEIAALSTLAQVDMLAQAISARAAAIGARDAAADAAHAAEADAGEATAQAAAAGARAAKAREWATKDEDAEVEPGEYSARHWSAKAQGHSEAAQTWDPSSYYPKTETYTKTEIDGAIEAHVQLTMLSYDGRAAMRSRDGPADKAILVEELGLFRWVVGSAEPDDDETCFATATGRWLLEAVSWDVAFSYWLPEHDAQEIDLAEVSANAAAAAKAEVAARGPRYGAAVSAVTSIAATSQIQFTGSVPGAAIGDRVIATPPGLLNRAVAYGAFVSAANTVTVFVNNLSASTATDNVGEGTWKLAILKELA